MSEKRNRRCARCNLLLAGRCFLVGSGEYRIERPGDTYRPAATVREYWLCSPCHYRMFGTLVPLALDEAP